MWETTPGSSQSILIAPGDCSLPAPHGGQRLISQLPEGAASLLP